jgi:hypothetical protein
MGNRFLLAAVALVRVGQEAGWDSETAWPTLGERSVAPAGVQFPAEARYIFLPDSIQTSYKPPPPFLSLLSGGHYGSSLGGRGAGSWNWPLIFIYCRGWKWWVYISTPPYSFMPWRVIKHVKSINFPFRLALLLNSQNTSKKWGSFSLDVMPCSLRLF